MIITAASIPLITSCDIQMDRRTDNDDAASSQQPTVQLDSGSDCERGSEGEINQQQEQEQCASPRKKSN